MGALMFLCKVKQPVVVKVAARAHRTESQDRFRGREGPPCAGTTHTVLDEISTRPLDDAGRNRQPLGERTVVVEELGVPDEVFGRALDGARGLGGAWVLTICLRLLASPDPLSPFNSARNRVSTQASASSVPGGVNAYAAFHRYSSTCTTSSTIVISTPTLRAARLMYRS